MANQSQQQSINAQDVITSVAAKASQAIRDAIESAFDSTAATVIEGVGKNLVRSLTNLAKVSDDAANNTFKIKNGLMGSSDISKQLLTLEERKLTLIRQRRLAELGGIQIKGTALEAEFKAVEKVLKAQQKQILREKAITDSVDERMGLVGKLTGALSALPGIGKALKLKELEQELRATLVTTNRRGNLVLREVGSARMLLEVTKKIGIQLGKAILDPATIAAKFTEQLFSINKASVELRRLTGGTVESYGDLTTGAANAVQVLETAAELTRQTGLNAQYAFSKEVIANAASLKVEMGLAAEEAGAIAIMAQTSGKSVNGITKSIVATTSAFNGANRTAIAQGTILRDVAKTSDSIKLSLGNNPTALANAASQARRLGVDLNQLNQIASSLLDFESSIEAELEAQLLTGNQINLSKARELALNNDIEGVGKELFKNTVDIEKFGRMGRLGQEAQAKALGLTRDQLARIAYQRGIDAKMTAAQAAAAADVAEEDMRRLTIQENFTAAINKVMAAFAPVLDMVGNLLSNQTFGPLIAGASVATVVLLALGSQLATIIGFFTAKTAALAASTAATTAQAGANAGLATSQNAVASTGAASAGAFARMGTALGAFGASAAAAIPVLLSIAAVAAGIGIAFLGVAQALKTIPEILKLITPGKAVGLLSLGPAFGTMAAGLGALAVTGLAALPALYGLKSVGLLGGVAATAQQPIVAAQAAPQTMSTQPIADEIKKMSDKMERLLQKLVAKNTDIYLDSQKINEAIVLGNYVGQ